MTAGEINVALAEAVSDPVVEGPRFDELRRRHSRGGQEDLMDAIEWELVQDDRPEFGIASPDVGDYRAYIVPLPGGSRGYGWSIDRVARMDTGTFHYPAGEGGREPDEGRAKSAALAALRRLSSG